MWGNFSDPEKCLWHLGPNSLRGWSRGLRGSIPDAGVFRVPWPGAAWSSVHILSPRPVGVQARCRRGPERPAHSRVLAGVCGVCSSLSAAVHGRGAQRESGCGSPRGGCGSAWLCCASLDTPSVRGPAWCGGAVRWPPFRDGGGLLVTSCPVGDRVSAP